MVGAGEMACPVRSREGDRDENVLVWTFLSEAATDKRSFRATHSDPLDDGTTNSAK